jgi:hypothetical protein
MCRKPFFIKQTSSSLKIKPKAERKNYLAGNQALALFKLPLIRKKWLLKYLNW